MSDFSRVLKLALRYRWTFAASLVCAIAVGVLWGGNLTAIYPFAEVAFRRASMHEWADEKVATAEAKIASLEAEIAKAASAAQTAAEEDRDSFLSEKASLEADLAAEHKAVERYRWVNVHVIEPYMPHDAFGTMVLVTVLLLVGTVIKSIFLIANTILVSRLAQLVTFKLSQIFYRRTLRMDLASFTNEGTSELMSRFTYDMESLSNGLRELFGKMVREPLKMIACLAGAAVVCWRLLLLSLILAPIAAVLIRLLARALKRANRRAMEEMSQIYNTLDETFQGITAVKAFTMERYERRRFHVNRKEFYRKAMKIARYDSLTRPLTEMLGISMICLALLAGAYLGINQETHLLGIRMTYRPLDFGSLMLFFGLLAGISDPARKMSEVFSRIQRAAAASDRIYQLLDREPTIVEPSKPVPLPRHHRQIAFEGLHFHYKPDQPVLQDVNLRIRYGETLAIVGPNGCGKTTLANLIPRFYEPIRGRVMIDDIDIRNVRFRDLRRQIGIVTQETLLFDDSVMANIRYGNHNATLDEVIHAAQQAHAHRFITEKLDRGYDTVIGPRGSMLSGGQRQRISLARAILRDPAILILDEATSQIDLESEQVIHKVLEQFTRDRTTLIITHRMATLALADRIAVMQGGQILDIGTNDELLRRCDLYARLHDIQFREIA